MMMDYARLNRTKNNIFKVVGLISTFIGLVLLAYFLVDILIDGLGRIDGDFISHIIALSPISVLLDFI